MNPSAPAARRTLLDRLAECALEAGAEIWCIFEAGFEVLEKDDLSPVTVADHAAEAIILKALATHAPGVPVVAEEEAAAGRIPEVAQRFFLVDPLDGTREFIRRGTDFTVNIGLIEHGEPTLGVVYAPARRTLYAGDAALGEAWRAKGVTMPSVDRRHPLRVRDRGAAPVALASRSHDVPATENYLQAVGAGERISIGSSLKFALLAEGEADIYPRPSPTMEWDTAAGHAVLLAAGGRAFAPDGSPLRYGKPRFYNPGFVAIGGGWDANPAPAIGPFMDEAAAPD